MRAIAGFPRRLKRLGVSRAPMAVSFVAAGAAGLSWALLTPGGRSLSADMAVAYGGGILRGVRLAGAWKAWRFRQAATAVRLEESREDPARWTTIWRNSAHVERLMAEGKSFILTCGHFAAIAPMALLYNLRARNVYIVYGGKKEFDWMMSWMASRPNAHGATVHFAHVGEGSDSALELVRGLSEPGTVVWMSMDLNNEVKPRYWRPFGPVASYPIRPYAARLARLAQCPVVYHVTTTRLDDRAVTEFGAPLQPPARNDKEGEIALTDRLLDQLEVSMGRHPEQYARFGEIMLTGRRWNRRTERWE